MPRVFFQDNLWFTAAPDFANYRRNGRSMIAVTPLLGLTDSSDEGAKAQELQWLLRYTGRTGSGLVVAQEWIRPDHRIEENLPLFLELLERHGRRARWCVFYDPVLALRQRGFGEEPPYDFSAPEVLRLWRDDLDHLERYFGGAKYHRIDDRPVLYVWAVHGGIRNADEAFLEADRRGLYVLGDVLGGRLEPRGMRGATGFVSALPGASQRDLRLVDEALPLIERELEYWRSRGDLIPAGSLQYDDTEFRLAAGDGVPPTRILAASRDQVERFVARLAEFAEIDQLFLGTANNWAEGTTVLPTERQGQAFRSDRLGHYRFEHLEAIREVLFPRVREYDGPRIKVKRIRGGEAVVDLKDFDVLGKLRVRPRDATRSLDTLSGFTRRWRGAPGARITLVNLDGRRTVETVG